MFYFACLDYGMDAVDSPCAGHAGGEQGHGHFSVRIVSAAFAGLSPLARHRAVYAALGDMMQSDIHALAIRAETP